MNEPEPVSTEQLTVAQWVAKLSQATGLPGGGAGSAVMLSVAAGLICMVAGYSEDADASGEAMRIKRRGQILRTESLRLADEDASCSESFGQAFHTPSGPARSMRICAAALNAARSSADIGRHAAAGLNDLHWLSEHGNPALIADLAVLLGALRASISGSRANIYFDLSTMQAHRDSERPAEEPADLYGTIERLDRALVRIDQLSAQLDTRIRNLLPDS
ncbi:cyclodeaminase/cyclohydrolase family protein [Glutamicibacter sp. NPDC087344]|uniref:cyclodeaminase/cyclohydrolase family protein n=1 Tax=Glutamicibacter sp. NPDC087344 TaxID=3363994 RepID=UPI0038177886